MSDQNQKWPDDSEDDDVHTSASDPRRWESPSAETNPADAAVQKNPFNTPSTDEHRNTSGFSGPQTGGFQGSNPPPSQQQKGNAFGDAPGSDEHSVQGNANFSSPSTGQFTNPPSGQFEAPPSGQFSAPSTGQFQPAPGSSTKGSSKKSSQQSQTEGKTRAFWGIVGLAAGAVLGFVLGMLNSILEGMPIADGMGLTFEITIWFAILFGTIFALRPERVRELIQRVTGK